MERRAREITIHSLGFLGWEDGDAVLRIGCSKGTYIRTLCHDIGEALGCGACMSYLRRTAAGEFSLEMAHSLDEVIAIGERGEGDGLLLSVDRLFESRPRLSLTAKQEKLFRNGVRFSIPGEEMDYRVYSPRGEFLALAKIEKGLLVSIKTFFEVN